MAMSTGLHETDEATYSHASLDDVRAPPNPETAANSLDRTPQGGTSSVASQREILIEELRVENRRLRMIVESLRASAWNMLAGIQQQCPEEPSDNSLALFPGRQSTRCSLRQEILPVARRKRKKSYIQ